jgi:hypothetical protein
MATKSLFEAYKNRLAVANTVYGKMHNGETMSQNRKLVTAKCLENVNRFMNEAFEQSAGTQRSDMGMFKKFAMNLTTVALPNLIAHDLVIVHPMSSMSGYITYIEYQYASNKGGIKQGDPISNPFGFGNMGPDSDAANFTSNRVVETVKVGDDGTATLAWAPVFVTTDARALSANASVVGVEGATIDVVDADKGVIKITGVAAGTEVKVKYVYNNIVIPQNDLPMIKAEMKSLPLVAKARRIAVYYSQIAAYQAKTDYGVDLGDQLAEKAVGELSYEIDTEITNMLVENAAEDDELVWSKTLPVGVSKAEHYEGFAEILEIAKQKIYDATKKFAPNYVICASNLLPVLSVVKSWHAAPAGQINGPYFAGTINGLKVFVTPNIEAGKFVVGCNGNDMMSSAAVYAPYMAIVPTQLLGYADGGMSQGWSTLYDLRMLNSKLLVAGRMTA